MTLQQHECDQNAAFARMCHRTREVELSGLSRGIRAIHGVRLTKLGVDNPLGVGEVTTLPRLLRRERLLMITAFSLQARFRDSVPWRIQGRHPEHTIAR